ncbi:MAG: NEDD8-conjugating enzyme Ubc12 [Amphiamblys sp. WSBS2006]|nr:MAG: NEDD8-conjugating enzyme Ubc12 [Amphiamblys sp. WSBS2006]
MLPAAYRIQKDLNDMKLPPSIKVSLQKLTEIHVEIDPSTGPYSGCTLPFLVRIPEMYPHCPPRVFCTKRVYHPNIDADGPVCLSILNINWRPFYTLETVFVSLLNTILEPSVVDPLNSTIAEHMQNDHGRFLEDLEKSTHGVFNEEGVEVFSKIRRCRARSLHLRVS